MAKNRRKVLLLDGSGLIFRAYYAFIKRPLTTSRGENTSAIFGFIKVFAQIVRDFKPDVLVTAFDLSRDTFRRKIYEQYKAQRQETPPDLKAQIPEVIDILGKMGVPVLEMQDYEADDIIGTLAEKLKKDDDIYIVSGDKDLLQLVDKNVRAIRPQHGISEINLVDREGVKAALGIYPEQVADYLAITGDTSDNIPGVKGIGDKGALSLLSQFKDLDDIYAHIGDIQGAAQKKLIDSKDNAYLSKQLATIKRDIEIDDSVTSAGLDVKNFVNPEVTEKLEHYQLTSVLNDLKKLASGNAGAVTAEKKGLFTDEENAAVEVREFSGTHRLVVKKKELEELAAAVRKQKAVSLDTETTSANPVEAKIIGISVSLEEGEGSYVPVLHDVKKDFDENDVFAVFKKLLEDDGIKKTGQNIKYEIEVFANYGIRMKGIAFDTMLAAYLLNPTRPHNNLENLTQEYLGLKKKSSTDVLKAVDHKEKTLLDAPVAAVTEYACADSDAALRLKNRLEPLIGKNGLEKVFYEMEMPLAPVLAVMERNGVKIDVKKLKSLSDETAASLSFLEKKIYSLAGREFNINSPKQLAKIFFEEMGLESVKKTDGGLDSTDEEVLKELSLVHPLPAEILSYRTLAKLKGTYMDALPEMVLKETGRIHTSFNQTITATGRLSSSDPNLQNIPVRDEIGRKIREAFVADRGHVLVSADYSQIELRVLAHFCGDPNMKQAFSGSLDIHRHTASLIFDVGENEVTEDMRRKAKSVNFGILYGLSAFGLSRQIGISNTEARLFIESYFRSFPKVKAFVDNTLREVSETGEVRTFSGRYRKFPDLIGKTVKESGQLNASQRMALNTRIQGSAADIIKIAMIRLQAQMEKKKMASKLILQIHDELVVEAADNEADDIKTMMKDIMENAYPLSVPLTVDIGAGKNWSEAH